MNVIRPGSEIAFCIDRKLTGLVSQVAISGHAARVTYEVVYWVGGDRKTCWVDDCEIIRTAESRSLPIRLVDTSEAA